MPIENELKFILDVEDPEKFQKTIGNLPKAESYEYRQGYLNDNTRIRSIRGGDTELFVFTYKNKVNGKLIEIETDISESDFNHLWIKITKMITKTRIKVPHGDYIWEVDFIKTPINECYLVMVEVEMPDGITDPGVLPPFVADNLLFAVPPDDLRFANTQLTVPNVVRRTVMQLKFNKENGVI